MSAVFFGLVQFHEPSQESMVIFEVEREDQEPFLIDLPLLFLNGIGGLFALQAINHAMWFMRDKRKHPTDQGPDETEATSF